jgi:acyl carrier protein
MLALKWRVPPAEIDEVLERLSRRLPHVLARVQHDTRIDELPLDSLDVLELLCVIDHEFGVRLTQEMFERAKTAADLAKVIARNSSTQRKAGHALR